MNEGNARAILAELGVNPEKNLNKAITSGDVAVCKNSSKSSTSVTSPLCLINNPTASPFSILNESHPHFLTTAYFGHQKHTRPLNQFFHYYHTSF